MQISINSHSSIWVDDMVFDPYNISGNECKIFDTKKEKLLDEKVKIDGSKKAKYVLLTHTHYDHLSIEDLSKIIDNDTVIIATPDAKTELEKNFKNNDKFFIRPNEAMELDGITISTISSYNLNKDFHKKEFGWVGYKVTKNDETFAVVGDTDATPELENLTCDILFVPIGGTYTMTAEEASNVTNKINPKIAIPTHYGSIVGSKSDAEIFVKNLNKNITPVVLID